jgi:hypothetical protein
MPNVKWRGIKPRSPPATPLRAEIPPLAAIGLERRHGAVILPATSTERKMVLRRWICAGLIFVLGALQAWDSGVLRAELPVVLLVCAALVIPAAAVFREAWQIRVASLVISAALLLGARMLSPLSHNELHLATFIAAMLHFFEARIPWKTQTT